MCVRSPGAAPTSSASRRRTTRSILAIATWEWPSYFDPGQPAKGHPARSRRVPAARPENRAVPRQGIGPLHHLHDLQAPRREARLCRRHDARLAKILRTISTNVRRLGARIGHGAATPSCTATARPLLTLTLLSSPRTVWSAESAHAPRRLSSTSSPSAAPFRPVPHRCGRRFACQRRSSPGCSTRPGPPASQGASWRAVLAATSYAYAAEVDPVSQQAILSCLGADQPWFRCLHDRDHGAGSASTSRRIHSFDTARLLHLFDASPRTSMFRRADHGRAAGRCRADDPGGQDHHRAARRCLRRRRASSDQAVRAWFAQIYARAR